MRLEDSDVGSTADTMEVAADEGVSYVRAMVPYCSGLVVLLADAASASGEDAEPEEAGTLSEPWARAAEEAPLRAATVEVAATGETVAVMTVVIMVGL